MATCEQGGREGGGGVNENSKPGDMESWLNRILMVCI